MASLRHYGIIFLAITIVAAACKQKEKAAEETPAETRTSVTVVQPVRQSLTDFIELNGNTVFQKKVVIRANIAGYITDIAWKVGDRISSGAVFCTIKTKEQDALKNIDQREPSLQQFRQPLKITTTAAGFLTTVNYIAGDYVNEGDILATVTIPSSLVLSVNVPYEYHAFVFNGRSCQVILPDGKKINTAITFNTPVIDAASQTQQFFIHLPASEQLPENMNLLVKIPKKQQPDVLCLPLAAIQTNETQDEFWVMKLVGDSMAVHVPVTVGSQNDSLKAIESGITASDRIIVKGGYGLADSALVTIEK